MATAAAMTAEVSLFPYFSTIWSIQAIAACRRELLVGSLIKVISGGRKAKQAAWEEF